MRRASALALACVFLAGCTEVTVSGGRTVLTFSAGFLMAVASPGLVWLTTAALGIALFRRFGGKKAPAQEDQPGPRRSPLLVGCAVALVLVGLGLLLPVVPFALYRVDVGSQDLLIRELSTTALDRSQLDSIERVPGFGIAADRVRIAARDGRVFWVNEAEVGSEGFERIAGALTRLGSSPDDTFAPPAEPRAGSSDAPAPAPTEAPAPKVTRRAAFEPARGAPPEERNAAYARLGPFVLASVWGSDALQHAGGVEALAVDPTGKRALTGGDGGVIHVWDLGTLREERTLRGHAGWVEGLDVSPDGRRALSWSDDDGTVTLWDLETGAALLTREARAPAVFLDAERALLGEDEWQLETDRFRELGRDQAWRESQQKPIPRANAPLERWPDGSLGGGRPRAFAYTRALDLYADAGGVGRFGEGDVRMFHAGGAPLAFSPDGKLLAAGSSLYEVPTTPRERGQDPSYPHPLRRLEPGEGGIVDLAFSPDGAHIAIAPKYGFEVVVCDVASGKRVHAFQGHAEGPRRVAWVGDGRLLSAGGDGALRVWDPARGVELGRPGHRGAITSLTFSPDGRRALSGSLDWTARVWDVAQDRELRCLEGHEYRVAAVAISPDGRTGVTAAWDRSARVWDLERGEELSRLEVGATWLWSATFSADAANVFLGTQEHTVLCHDARTGRQVRVSRTDGPVRALGLQPDGSLLLASGALEVWGPRSQRLDTLVVRPTAVAVTPDGTRLLCGGLSRDQKALRVVAWDLAAGRELAAIETAYNRRHPTPFFAFSRDGRWVLIGRLTGVEDGTKLVGGPEVALELWDLTSGKLTGKLDASSTDDFATAASFSPDGRTLLVGTARGVVLRYRLEEG